jgi:3-methyladenine DNA glycosylase Tag
MPEKPVRRPRPVPLTPPRAPLAPPRAPFAAEPEDAPRPGAKRPAPVRKPRVRKPTPPEKIVARIADPTLADALALMTQAMFQAGVSWAVVAAKWPAFRTAFEDFDVAKVAAYDDEAIARVLATPNILRSERKVRAVVANAQALVAIEKDFGSFHDYAMSFRNYKPLEADFHKRFMFVGGLSTYYVLFRLGERVPKFEHWETTIKGDHPRMREMVAKGRSEKTSSELSGF